MRIVATILLMAVAMPSAAEWVKITEDRDIAIYADPATIRKNGTLRRVWELRDLKGRSPGNPQSDEVHFEYDCYGDRMRMIESILYAEAMGKGRVLGREKYDQHAPVWTPIPRRTSLEPVLRFVCDR